MAILSLGGEDFDQRIIDHIIDEFKKINGLDLSKDPIALQRIKASAERAKIELSSSQQTEINEPYIAMANGAPMHLNLKMTRAKLESLVEELISQTRSNLAVSRLMMRVSKCRDRRHHSGRRHDAYA
jgi:molecular chaperone DnaK